MDHHHLDLTYICDAKSHEHQSCGVLELLQKKIRAGIKSLAAAAAPAAVAAYFFSTGCKCQLCTCCFGSFLLVVLSFLCINSPKNYTLLN